MSIGLLCSKSRLVMECLLKLLISWGWVLKTLLGFWEKACKVHEKTLFGSWKNLAWFGSDGNYARSVAKSGTLGDLIYSRLVRKLGTERE